MLNRPVAPDSPADRDPRRVLCAAFLAAAFVYHLTSVLQGWSRPIADFNPWRQSQTAITAWYFLRDGFSLAYTIPVLGPPWSLPFEFPTYQGLVAGLASLTGAPLESCGRAVSLAAFYGTLPAVNLLLKRVLGLGWERWFVLSFLLLSPTYISWSRAFSIESTALLLGIWYIFWFHRWILRPTPVNGAALLILGILGALTKVTTLFLCAAATVPILLAANPDLVSSWRPKFRWLLLTGVMAYVIPLVAAIGWTRYADTVKAASPLAGSLTTGAMSAWNFGTLDQRLSLDSLRQFELYAHNLVGSRYTLLLAALSAALFAGRIRTLLVLTGLFALGPVVFTNLYLVHDYYWYANGFFILIALGVAFTPLVSRPGVSLLAGGLACTLIFYQYRNIYNDWYGPTQRQVTSPLLPLAAGIKSLVAPNDYCVVYGLTWDPILAYHSQRRMIMETAALEGVPVNRPPLATAIENAGREHLGAIVFIGNARTNLTFVREQLNLLGIKGDPDYEDSEGMIYRLSKTNS